jgi:hypothetical protein
VALGESTGLPMVVFLASGIVQTHVGYGAPIAALAGTVLVARRRAPRKPVSRNAQTATAAVLVVCWMLPLYEAVTSRPGNIQWLIEFFAPDNLAKQSWTVAWAALREQAAVMPLAIVRTFDGGITPSPLVQALICLLECGLLVVVIVTSIRRRDRILTVLAAIPLIQWIVAIFAVRAIRQAMEFYLVAWISVIGLVASIVFAAWMIRMLERRFGSRAQVMVAIPAAMLIVTVLVSGAARPPAFREPDLAAETLARDVESFLRASQIDGPLIRIESRDAWPVAVAVVLYLSKRGLPVYVEDEWLYVAGRQFAAPSGTSRELHFANRASVAQMPADAIVSRAAGGEDLAVYLAR